MRRTLLGLAAVLAVMTWSGVGFAQGVNNPGGFSDPFFLYYGWYLPQQNALTRRTRRSTSVAA